MSRLVQMILGVAAAIVVIAIGVVLWNAATGGGGDKAPTLTITTPREGAQVSGDSVAVKGTTKPGAQVRVNNRSARVDKNGGFQATVPLESDQSFIFVKSTYKGRDTIVQRSVTKVAASPVPTISSGVPAGGRPAAQPQSNSSQQPLSTTGPGDWLSLFGLALATTLGVFWRMSRTA